MTDLERVAKDIRNHNWWSDVINAAIQREAQQRARLTEAEAALALIRRSAQVAIEKPETVMDPVWVIATVDRVGPDNQNGLQASNSTGEVYS